MSEPDPEVLAIAEFCRADPIAAAKLIIRLRAHFPSMQHERMKPPATKGPRPMTPEEGAENFRLLELAVAEWNSANISQAAKASPTHRKGGEQGPDGRFV